MVFLWSFLFVAGRWLVTKGSRARRFAFVLRTFWQLALLLYVQLSMAAKRNAWVFVAVTVRFCRALWVFCHSPKSIPDIGIHIVAVVLRADADINIRAFAAAAEAIDDGDGGDDVADVAAAAAAAVPAADCHSAAAADLYRNFPFPHNAAAAADVYDDACNDADAI